MPEVVAPSAFRRPHGPSLANAEAESLPPQVRIGGHLRVTSAFGAKRPINSHRIVSNLELRQTRVSMSRIVNQHARF
jgi:hypothetical protein